MDEEGRGVPSAGPAQPAAAVVVDPVPDREEHVIVALHRKGPIQCREDGRRIPEIGVWQRLTADGIER